MEDKWFVLLRDTMSIAGNVAECIGLFFLFTQFRRRPARNSSSSAAPAKRRAPGREVRTYDRSG